MNCYRGICKHKTDDGYCQKDLLYSDPRSMNKCDMVKEDPHIHKCRYGYLGCDSCYMYWYCDET